jgi:hypothetical protein
MMRRFVIVMMAAILVIAAALEVSAQSPTTFVYQGRLADTSGTPISTTTSNVVFAIYAAASGGTALYTSAPQTISPDKFGVFTIKLGPVGASVFDGTERYLGIKIGSDAEMTPRQVIASTPYSLNTNAIANNAVTAAKIADEPGVAYGHPADPNALIALSATAKALASVTITAPTAGYVNLTAWCSVFINHTYGTWDNVLLKISKTSAEVGTPSFQVSVTRIPGELPTGSNSLCTPATLNGIFAVSAGANTFYLNGLISNGANASVLAPNLSAMFFPTAYGATAVAEGPGGGGTEVTTATGR